MKKKIFVVTLLVLIGILTIHYCVGLGIAIQKNIEWSNLSNVSLFQIAVNKVNNEYLIRIVLYALLLLLNVAIVIFAFPFIRFPVKYTYEQYKEYRQEKKVKKQKAKLEKLQKQLKKDTE